MSRFTSPLVIEEVQPGRRWRLREPIRYEVGSEGSGIVIEVPAGFETDGATIPPVLRIMLAVWGTYGRAACIHDYLYTLLRERRAFVTDIQTRDVQPHPAFAAMAGMPFRTPEQWLLGRRWADQEFHTAMLACGTRPALAWIMWIAVRLFGRIDAG